MQTVGELRVAQFWADRSASAWDAGEPLREGTVTGRVRGFVPNDVPPVVWHEIGEVVRSAVERSSPKTPYGAKTLMSVVTQAAWWCHREGLPVEDSVLFHPDTIDRFVTTGCDGRSEGTRLNYRTKLRRVGEQVLGPALYPPRPVPLARSGRVEGYDEHEIADLLTWASALPTDLMRSSCHAVIAVGLGAGLTSQELASLTGDDVVEDDLGVALRVLGSRARVVPVLRRWEPRVRELRNAGLNPIVLPGRDRVRRNEVARLLERCPRGTAPPLSIRRLRATWIRAHLSLGTPLRVLEAAAGVSASHLVEYLPPAEGLTEPQIRSLLRDPGER